jgi:3',5'-nucleoside bisphosphate phosphatase
MRIDLHTHSSVSDGTDPPEELVRRAAAVGLDVVALTDHDTFDGLDAAADEGERIGIELVGGVELSCSRHGSSVHLLGYGADPGHPELAAAQGADCAARPARHWLERLPRHGQAGS